MNATWMGFVENPPFVVGGGVRSAGAVVGAGASLLVAACEAHAGTEGNAHEVDGILCRVCARGVAWRVVLWCGKVRFPPSILA